VGICLDCCGQWSVWYWSIVLSGGVTLWIILGSLKCPDQLTDDRYSAPTQGGGKFSWVGCPWKVCTKASKREWIAFARRPNKSGWDRRSVGTLRVRRPPEIFCLTFDMCTAVRLHYCWKVLITKHQTLLIYNRRIRLVALPCAIHPLWSGNRRSAGLARVPFSRISS
jgi:hypothetical protein